MPKRLLPGFRLNSLCVSDVESGRAQVVTDFVADDHRLPGSNSRPGQLTPLRRSIVVRRHAGGRDLSHHGAAGTAAGAAIVPDLRAMETELTVLVGTLSDASTTDKAQAALMTLNGLSVRSGQLSERLGYRFAASQAYGNILRTRLAGLKETPTTLGRAFRAISATGWSRRCRPYRPPRNG